MMKAMVCHFESDSLEVMTALVVVLPLIVVVEISPQLHRYFIQGPSPSPVLFTLLLVIQDPPPLALALWEEPRPLATRDRDALRIVDEPSGSLVAVERPPDL
jgi:hypothetical protein